MSVTRTRQCTRFLRTQDSMNIPYKFLTLWKWQYVDVVVSKY